VTRNRILSFRAVELLLVAVIGGALALGGAALFGRLGSHTTIQQVSPLGGGGGIGNAALQVPTHGLSAEQIYKRDAPGVVQITATSVTKVQTDPFNVLPPTSQTSQSLGSGFVIDKAGHIVTNYHVVQGAQRLQVSFSGQDQIAATVVGSDPSTDTAVLKIDQHARALQPLELGDSSAVRVGDSVFAIGNPFGLTRTLTSGIVSAVQRQISAPNTLAIDNAIQTDAAINHGNSGGPLLDEAGRVLGINSQIESGNGDGAGVGFAVPIDVVRRSLEQLRRTGEVHYAYLGIQTLEVYPQLAARFDLGVSRGAYLDEVLAGGPAAKAGLKGASGDDVRFQGARFRPGGDVITKVGPTTITRADEVSLALTHYEPGQTVPITISRDGHARVIRVKLAERPPDTRPTG
jgi:S1-C subfamily serine protease